MTRWSITAAAHEAPDRIALIAEDQAFTYRALAARVRGATSALAQVGVPFPTAGRTTAEAREASTRDGEPGRVMMVAPNTVDTVCAVLALIEQGTPVMLIHPRSTGAERAALRALYPPAIHLDAPPESTPVESAEAPSVPPDVPAERDLAVFFTSGTTGRPKAVRLSRRAFEAAAVASAENLGWVPDDRWLLTIPVAHVGGFSILTRCLLARRTVVLLDGPTDPGWSRRRSERDRVTLMSLVPTQLKRWLPEPPGASVRAVLLGGAPAPVALRAAARAAGWPILATYGLTEACSQVTVQPYASLGDEGPTGGDEDSGLALPGTELTIRNGHIWMRSPTLLTGYVEPSDEVRPIEPFDPDGWFDTGDIGHLDERGRLTVYARRSDLILSGGENVYPKEVEAALLRVPGVSDAVVFGVDDPEWGQMVAAALEAGEGLDRSALDLAVRETLAGPKRPRRWAVLSRFPLTPSGKIDRRRVVEIARPRLAHAP